MEVNENMRLSSRARPRKPHEPDPFLSLDIIHSPLEKQGEIIRQRKPQRSMADRLSIGNASNRSTPRASAVPLESSRKVIEFVKPSVYAKGTNCHVKKPFKHAIDKSQIVSKDQNGQNIDPSLQLADKSALAAYQVQQVIGRPKSAGASKQNGRLQKGRLRQAYPVKISGPSIEQCRGVIADRRLAHTSEKVERRGYLVASLQHNPGLLTTGDGTSSIEALDRTESLHQPSEASSEAGEETDRLRQLADELGQSEVTTGLASEEQQYEANATSPHTAELLRLLSSQDLQFSERPLTQPAMDQGPIIRPKRRPSTTGERPKSVRFAADHEIEQFESCREAANVDKEKKRDPDDDEPDPNPSQNNSPFVRSAGTISSLSSNFSPANEGGGEGGGGNKDDVNDSCDRIEEIEDEMNGRKRVGNHKIHERNIREAWTSTTKRNKPQRKRQRRCKSAGTLRKSLTPSTVLFDRDHCPLFLDNTRKEEDATDEVCYNFEDLDRQLEQVLNEMSEIPTEKQVQGQLSELLCDKDIANNKEIAIHKMAAEMKRLLSNLKVDGKNRMRIRSAPPRTSNINRSFDISGKTLTLHHRSSSYDAPAKFPPMCFRINTTPPNGKLYYFAYGLDVNAGRLASILRKSVTDRRWGVLFGFKLRFNRKGKEKGGFLFANVEYDSNSSVEGAIYTLDVEDLSLLDKCFDHPKSNCRMILPIWTSQCSECGDDTSIARQCVPGLLFSANPQATVDEKDIFNPSCEYSINQCLLGGGDIFSDNYQIMLKSRLR